MDDDIFFNYEVFKRIYGCMKNIFKLYHNYLIFYKKDYKNNTSLS